MTNGTHTIGRHAQRAARGFTLLELMVVLVIIGILGTILTINVVGATDRARINSTEATMKSIQGALKLYYARYSNYPAMDVGLEAVRMENLITEEIKDSWGNLFDYYSPADQYAYEIISAGKDQEFGTVDDIILHPPEGE